MERSGELWGTLAALAIAGVLVLLAADNVYLVNLATIAAIYAILSLGLGVLCGMAGQMSMGHGALFGIGAYITAYLVTTAGLPFWPAIALAVVGTALSGVLMGLVALRFEGIYFAVVTFAFSAVVMSAMENWRTVTGGANGLAAEFDPPAMAIAGLNLAFTAPLGLLALIGLSLAAALVIVGLILRTRFGHACLAIREDEVLARCLGIRVFRCKLAAFAISSALAGWAGGWYATYLKYITPELFTVSLSIELLMVLIIGGMLSPLAGPLVGSVVLVGLPEALRFTEGFRAMLFGLLAILIILLMPEGIMGGVALAARRFGIIRRPAAPLPSSGDPAARAAAVTALLRTEGLACRFGNLHALRGVDLHIEEGEILGLIGPNGAGKTTFFNVMTGLTPASAGATFWRDADISRLAVEERARLGIIRTFQQARAFQRLSVADNLRLAQGRGGRLPDIAAILAETGMERLADRRGARPAICRAAPARHRAGAGRRARFSSASTNPRPASARARRPG